ncbi:glycosyltransferase [Pelagibacteraceae bacterium]|nr:glycosyltransferase [Pelagibacteraceae bacterium]
MKKKTIKIKSLSIIFPFFNEEKRLSESFKNLRKLILSLKKINYEIILVNDGSTDNSKNIIKKEIDKFKNKYKKKFKYINYKKNMGKGFALKKGVMASNKKWLLTCDIDFAANPKEIKVWQSKKYISSADECYFGSRNLEYSNIEYKFYRKFIGNIFSYFRNSFLNIELRDTQCGFKLYPRNIARSVFSKLTRFGYIHDVEICILLKKKNIRIKELPIKWKHVNNSKLNIFIDGSKMMFQLLLLKFR